MREVENLDLIPAQRRDPTLPPLLVAHQERTPSNSGLANVGSRFVVQAAEQTALPQQRSAQAASRITRVACDPQTFRKGLYFEAETSKWEDR
jgi:hypothetical protein